MHSTHRQFYDAATSKFLGVDAHLPPPQDTKSTLTNKPKDTKITHKIISKTDNNNYNYNIHVRYKKN